MFWKHKDEPEEVNTTARQQRYFKVALIGSKKSSSRTSFMQKCTGSNGNPVYKETTSCGNKIIFELWDTQCCATENADGVIIVYDITSRKSYNSALDEWEGFLKKNIKAVKMIIGINPDLAANREVAECEGTILADFIGAPLFHEVSSMTGAEIGVALSKLGISLIRKVFNPPTANVLPIKKFTDNMTMKVVFVGPDRSGTKTSLINRYVSGSFAESPTPQKRSTAVATEIKKIQVNGLTVNLSLTDAPGSERSVAPYLKTAIAAVVGYDITSKDSFSGCMKLCESIRTKYPSVFIMVVGGMSDKASNRSVSSEEAKARSKEAGAKLFFEVSAKTGGNVNESMNALVTEIIRMKTDIKAIDVSQNAPNSDNSNGHDDDDEIIDYDDGEPVPGTSFWAGHGSSGWSAKTAIASNTLPPLDKTKGYKIILLGAAVTAKTSFLKRYVYDTFNPEYLATIGVDFAIRKESCLGEEIKLMLWDTAGQERYEAITNSYLKGCIGMILTYDITDRRSIETIRRKYMTYWKDYPYITIMVIGSKLDLRDFREVPTEDGESLARDLHASLFFEVSAKTGEGVNEAMRALAKIIFLRASEMRAAMKAPAAPTQAQSSQKFSLFKKPKETRAENAEPRVVPSPSQQRPNQNGELRLKICFVGDTLTGAKTSFVNRYVHKTFSQDTAPTIGAKFDTKEVVSRGVTVHLDIWDTAGQERYRSLIPMYLINCNGIVVGYDITSKESLQVAGNRYSDLKARYPNAVIMVIGNKTDLEHNRRVSLEEGEVLTNAIRASIFFETSAKTGANVNRAMEALVDKILETKGY